MAVTSDITATYRGPRKVIARLLQMGAREDRLLAVLMGFAMLYNINPGPMMFREQPVVVGGLIASLYIGNVMLLLLNLPLAGAEGR